MTFPFRFLALGFLLFYTRGIESWQIAVTVPTVPGNAIPFQLGSGFLIELQSLPGLHKVQNRTDIPLDPPETASRKAADPARLEDEAEELARLSAGIPAQIQSVNLKKVPKDLDSQLKRIEKLAKHLRSQVSP